MIWRQDIWYGRLADVRTQISESDPRVSFPKVIRVRSHVWSNRLFKNVFEKKILQCSTESASMRKSIESIVSTKFIEHRTDGENGEVHVIVLFIFNDIIRINAFVLESRRDDWSCNGRRESNKKKHWALSHQWSSYRRESPSLFSTFPYPHLFRLRACTRFVNPY